jgi:hypothetical protein
VGISSSSIVCGEASSVHGWCFFLYVAAFMIDEITVDGFGEEALMKKPTNQA